MKIKTTRFGEVEIAEKAIITFAAGIPGFPEYKEYVVLETEEQQPFAYLQSLESEELAFIITDPFFFHPDYEFRLLPDVIEKMEITGEEDVIVRSVVTIRDNIQQATINLLGPLVMNLKNNRGMQVVLTDSQYSTKHPLIAASGGK